MYRYAVVLAFEVVICWTGGDGWDGVGRTWVHPLHAVGESISVVALVVDAYAAGLDVGVGGRDSAISVDVVSSPAGVDDDCVGGSERCACDERNGETKHDGRNGDLIDSGKDTQACLHQTRTT